MSTNKLLENLNYEELIDLKNKLVDGEIEKLIKIKLEKFKNTNKVCPVCNTPIGEGGLTLIFGSADFKRKAEFDAVDCLEYFISKIRK
jgi:tRNA(Ile2) C34 agmatinyltransferase TiaS